MTFLNPIRNLLLDALRRIADTVVFGDGYVSADDIAAEPARFVARNGPFDLVVGGGRFILPHYREASLIAERAYHAHAFRHDPHLMTSKAPFSFFRSFPGPRLHTFFESDYCYCNFGKQQIELIAGSDAICVGMGPELMATTSPDLQSDELSEVYKSILARTENRWTQFTASHPERVISSTHFVAKVEISSRPFDSRAPAWAIPGAHYAQRNQAKRHLDQARIRRVGKHLDYVLPIARRMKLNLNGPRWGQRLLNSLQQPMLTHARYAYTCGRVLRMPIRKFFEIPAAGTVLAATPSQLPQLHKELEADRGRARAIAERG